MNTGNAMPPDPGQAGVAQSMPVMSGADAMPAEVGMNTGDAGCDAVRMNTRSDPGQAGAAQSMPGMPGVDAMSMSAMPASASSLLEVLRDLHVPAAVSWWPPAPGWWFLSAAAVLGYLQWRYLLFTRWFRKPRRTSPLLGVGAVARDEMVGLRMRFDETRNVHELVSSLSILLRRVALELFPREEVAALTGESWLRWLDERAQGDVFSVGIGRVLIDAPYRSPEQVAATVDGEALLKACEGWVMTVTRGGGE